MNVKSFSNRIMVLAGVRAFLHYFVGGRPVNDPVKFVFVTGYEVNQKISHCIVCLSIEFVCGQFMVTFLRKVGYLYINLEWCTRDILSQPYTTS